MNTTSGPKGNQGKSKRVQILEAAAQKCGVPVGNAIKLGYALEQLNYQIVPTDETLEYWNISKEQAMDHGET